MSLDTITLLALPFFTLSCSLSAWLLRGPDLAHRLTRALPAIDQEDCGHDGPHRGQGEVIDH